MISRLSFPKVAIDQLDENGETNKASVRYADQFPAEAVKESDCDINVGCDAGALAETAGRVGDPRVVVQDSRSVDDRDTGIALVRGAIEGKGRIDVGCQVERDNRQRVVLAVDSEEVEERDGTGDTRLGNETNLLA